MGYIYKTSLSCWVRHWNISHVHLGLSSLLHLHILSSACYWFHSWNLSHTHLFSILFAPALVQAPNYLQAVIHCGQFSNLILLSDIWLSWSFLLFEIFSSLDIQDTTTHSQLSSQFTSHSFFSLLCWLSSLTPSQSLDLFSFPSVLTPLVISSSLMTLKYADYFQIDISSLDLPLIVKLQWCSWHFHLNIKGVSLTYSKLNFRVILIFSIET